MKKTTKVHLRKPDFPMLSLPNPDGSKSLVIITLCGHMYDAGLGTDVLDEVTCKSCSRRIP